MENNPKKKPDGLIILNADFWNNLWEKGYTGWDIGKASPPITEFLETYPNKNARILIPGCGNAYEAQFLVDNGFKNITLLDISSEAVNLLKIRFQNKPQVNVICDDFFNHQGQYDLIIEQTFFCTHDPRRRPEYVSQVASLLKVGGEIIGVLFGKEFAQPGPPFGGVQEDYRLLFEPLFRIKKMELCYNSIKPRAGSELFIHLIKK